MYSKLGEDNFEHYTYQILTRGYAKELIRREGDV